MKSSFLSILLLIFVPCILRAQTPARVGDTLELHLSGVPSTESAAFNSTYQIDDDGMINLPYIQKVKVAGLLPNQIQEAVQNRYVDAKIYTHPTVTVQQSVARFVNVNGHVKQSQRVPYTPDLTLMGVITACGGLDDFGSKKNVELMRDGKRTVYNLADIEKGKAPDPKVQPGDQVNVRESFW